MQARAVGGKRAPPAGASARAVAPRARLHARTRMELMKRKVEHRRLASHAMRHCLRGPTRKPVEAKETRLPSE